MDPVPGRAHRRRQRPPRAAHQQRAAQAAGTVGVSSDVSGLIETLTSALPPDVVVTDPDIIDPYRFDRAMTVRPGRPLAVVRAASTADVQRTLEIASRFRVPVVPRGAGTGLSGGSAAIDGCITLSTERMR